MPVHVLGCQRWLNISFLHQEHVVQRDNFPTGTDKEEDVLRMRCLALVSRSDCYREQICRLKVMNAHCWRGENVNNKNALVEYLGGLCLRSLSQGPSPCAGSQGALMGHLWEHSVLADGIRQWQDLWWLLQWLGKNHSSGKTFSLELFYQKSDTKSAEFGSRLQARYKSWFVSILRLSK